ncbi:tetratricopeptide repeat protein [Gilvimarinus sp. F26214L]|uniref:tetratricopeptide repeat protein n=1 Tax=Gilvimarinus sp. DZF01 TaxID=3461371 RepID=UPI004045D730
MRSPATRQTGILLVLLSTVLLGSACTPIYRVEAPDSDLLRRVLTPPAGFDSLVAAEPEVAFLALSPEMEAFVATAIPPGAGAEAKLDALFQTLRYNAAYFIEYDDNATFSAAEAFRQRRANCLAFSAMFIAMARHAGLDARFQEVDLPPAWDNPSGDTLVQYRHVNVKVRLRPGDTVVVDFRMDRYSETYPQRQLSDEGALAHYYSNIGMERLIAGRLDGAYTAARRALQADDGQPFIWNNMGTIQRRLGNPELAEASYRQALALDPRDWSALGNLANVLAQRGEHDKATELRAVGDEIKLRNPYYRYALAQHAFNRGNYAEALHQLDEAVERRRSEPRFFYLRGLSRWQLGDRDSAINDVKRAAAIATDSDPQVRYQRQLEKWQASQG